MGLARAEHGDQDDRTSRTSSYGFEHTRNGPRSIHLLNRSRK
jgi:hypothetical protein